MRNAFICLLVAFSLLVAPVAHAAGVSCEGVECQMVEQIKKQSGSTNQDDGKMALDSHHCCASHFSAPLSVSIASPELISEPLAFYAKDEFARSVIVGPSLKPPSRA